MFFTNGVVSVTQDHTSQPKTTEANRSASGIYLGVAVVVDAIDI